MDGNGSDRRGRPSGLAAVALADDDDERRRKFIFSNSQ